MSVHNQTRCCTHSLMRRSLGNRNTRPTQVLVLVPVPVLPG